jgi:hypothetical protein
MPHMGDTAKPRRRERPAASTMAQIIVESF